MKKIVTAVTCIVIAIGLFFGIRSAFITKSFYFNDAESVTISDLENKKVVEITDKEDKRFIETFCSGRNSFPGTLETPACFFDTVRVTIVKNGKTYYVYPTNDGCDNLLIKYKGTEYYASMNGSLKKFVKIVQKNRLSWT